MSIGSHLLCRENLELVGKKSWRFGRPEIIERGMHYYDAHPEEVQTIVDNLAFMGLPHRGAALDSVLREIVVHYYEKLFVLVKTYEAYWIARNRIEFGDSLEPFLEARETNKAVFIGQSHFGATYLMGIALMASGIDINVVGNFPEPVCSMMRATSGTILERHGGGTVQFINIADEKVDVPMSMMQLLSKRKVVSNVYDENNQFCREVSLLGRRLMGGTGMDLILRNYSDDNVIVVTPFLLRTSDETFRYELDRHQLGAGDVIASFYGSLEDRLKRNHEQWYFIHELHHSFPKR